MPFPFCNEDVIETLFAVYESWISESISNYNSDFFHDLAGIGFFFGMGGEKLLFTKGFKGEFCHYSSCFGGVALMPAVLHGIVADFKTFMLFFEI